PVPANRTAKPKAAFVALVRERQLHGLMMTMRDLQITFNEQPDNNYKYIFLSEKPFTPFFKNRMAAFLQDFPSPPEVEYGLVPKEDWDIPSHINMTKAQERWNRMSKTRIPYGGSKSYRQMCRFYSNTIFFHPLLKDLDYVWRIEPDTKHLCKYVSHYKKGSDGVLRWVERDPFRYMKEHGKKYAFSIAMKEYAGSVRTLFIHVNTWRWGNPHLIPKDNLRKFVSDDDKGYNKCHFWTNYEIIDLSFPRSEGYQSFFNHLDQVGGFFYERWGDAPVRSIAASLLLNKDQIWHVDYAGYYHPPYGTCPRVPDPGAQCACDPHVNYDYDASHISCKPQW
ncbi:nucleotide-diphospho-sugar transferase, partial [Meira miltonrushii]